LIALWTEGESGSRKAKEVATAEGATLCLCRYEKFLLKRKRGLAESNASGI